MRSLGWLRRQAVGWSLTRPAGSLAEAMAALEFVQADPIRAPARAQDLILRQRVRGYRAGDLERAYPDLEVEEDHLYAYGFLARDLLPALHPRRDPRSADGRFVLTPRAADVLAFVRGHGVTHPRDVQAHLGRERVANAWGGMSAATTVELERLRHFGHLRVADRVAGVRRYAVAPPLTRTLGTRQRVDVLAMLVARTLAPVPDATLSAQVNGLVRWIAEPGSRTGRSVVADLLAAGALQAASVDGTRYLWPADLADDAGDAGARVRILAPFDPLVWDRRRFGHLWGWDYRFEAYTPVAKRVLGYYAMPLLWREDVIGWATCAGPGAAVEVGYAGRVPTSVAYRRALAAEIARLQAFLAPAGIQPSG